MTLAEKTLSSGPTRNKFHIAMALDSQPSGSTFTLSDGSCLLWQDGELSILPTPIIVTRPE